MCFGVPVALLELLADSVYLGMLLAAGIAAAVDLIGMGNFVLFAQEYSVRAVEAYLAFVDKIACFAAAFPEVGIAEDMQ